MKIAIDGPSASGKGTISKILSQKFGAEYLNTGKIYRIIAVLSKDLKGDLKSSALQVASEITKHFKEQNQNTKIYTEEIAKITSEIAKIPELREVLAKFQQDFIKNHNKVILEGRDIGTVIMPNADFKFYLDASAEERAKRRVLQLTDAGKKANYEEILQEIKARDKNDTEREIAGLKIAQDAYYVSTDGKTIDEVITEITSIIEK
jgi:cytidylate kinase